MRDGKERHVLNIRIVFGRVRDDVVNVVVALPPSETQTSEIIGDEHANDTVDVEVVSDTHMTGIMGTEDQLVPESANEQGRDFVPAVVQSGQEHGKQERVS